MKLKRTTKPIMTAAIICIGTLAIQAEPAHAFDMDCKVILCLAGGFPAGCSDAYGYMIDRITRTPKPLPPFGFCAMSDGSEYQAHNVEYRYLNQGPSAYDCVQGTHLYYRREDEGRGFRRETAFCYTHTTAAGRSGREGEDLTVYHGRTPAIRVNFELQITIEPGTAHEFQSPLFRINYGTGYFSQRQS